MGETAGMQELMQWPKGWLVVTVMKGMHLPKTDTIGLCDPFVKVSLGEHSVKTKHVRKTLNPTWNETLELPVDAGEDVVGKFIEVHENNLEHARSIACLVVQLYDWDVTGNELIGHCYVEVYAIMERIGRPGAHGLELLLEVKDENELTVFGFDGQPTKLMVRIRFVLDEEAAQAKAAARLAQEERKRRKRMSLALEEERRLQSQIIEESLQRQMEAKERFLAQLQRESMMGGDVFACGGGAFGQTGLGHILEVITPALIRYEALPCTDMAAGVVHSLFINEEGNVLSCGSGEWGQLGLVQPGVSTSEEQDLGDEDFVYEQLVPREIHFHPPLFGSGSLKIVQVAAGARHTMMLSECGIVFSCGDGRYGALGYEEASQRMPRRVDKIAGCGKSVSAGSYHSLILTDDGLVSSCGTGNVGQLGDLLEIETSGGEEERGEAAMMRAEPQVIPGCSNIIFITSGAFHNLVIDREGQVFAFGSGGHGRLGIGEEVEKVLRPIKVCGLDSSVIMASAGDYHSLFLTGKQEVFATGSNQFGQLGLAGRGDTC